MNWNNLQENKCPKCSGYMFVSGDFTKCPFCTFRIRTGKLVDLTGGKESKAYIAVVSQRDGWKRKKAKEKKRINKATSIQNTEKISNMNRMLAKGEMSQTEYDLKMKALVK